MRNLGTRRARRLVTYIDSYGGYHEEQFEMESGLLFVKVGRLLGFQGLEHAEALVQPFVGPKRMPVLVGVFADFKALESCFQERKTIISRL